MDKNLDLDIEQRCRVVSELIHIGQYEQAQEALGELWQGIGIRPRIENLSPALSAEVLMWCGVLSGWLGTSHASDAQGKAKDLIFEALRIFKDKPKISEAQYELGICYWREGAYEEARIILKQALEGAKDELRAKILIRRTIVENCAGRYHDAWEILREAQEFFESCNDNLKGKWHGQMGLVLQRLALTEGREDYADRAIIEFTAAIYHYEQAGNERYAGINLNNLAMLLYPMGRFQETHESLDRAEEIFKNDSGVLAQVRETRARALLYEERYEEAFTVINSVVSVLEEGGEYSLFDALTVQGTVLARLNQHERSIFVLRRALDSAEDSGSFLNAGLAALTLIEEHFSRLDEIELHKLYHRAERLLENTQDIEALNRLKKSAGIVIDKLLGPQLTDRGFHLTKVVRAYEARFILQALELAEGRISRAGRLLGFGHHGTLASLLNRRHKNLKNNRLPPTPRRAAIKSKTKPKPTILYVGERSILRGWSVFKCDEITARGMIATEEYSLFIFESLELARYARLYHKRTPIIIISTSDMEAEAWKIGIQGFVQDTNKLPVMVKRLLR